MSAHKKFTEIQAAACWKLREHQRNREYCDDFGRTKYNWFRTFPYAVSVAADFFGVHRSTIYRAIGNSINLTPGVMDNQRYTAILADPVMGKQVKSLFRQLRHYYLQRKAPLKKTERDAVVGETIRRFPVEFWLALTDLNNGDDKGFIMYSNQYRAMSRVIKKLADKYAVAPQCHGSG
ncbi:MAG: hypothetical protein KBE65_23440 [Phycisphaerae bacterium]|nr:hypothetical protein [Phycisphaerae bacterium]